MFKKKRELLVLIAGLVFIFSMILTTTISSANDSVKVVRIVDGDTIVVKFDDNRIEKIRLIGIDTPETVHPKKPVEYFGKQASAYTKKHLLNKKVVLKYDWQKRDKYDRLLAYVFIDGQLFNKKMIRNGYALAYLKYPFNKEYMVLFRQAQEHAQKHKLGLWADQKQTIDTRPKKYVANKKSSIFHRPNCRYAKRIKPENRQYYTTRKQAIADGKRPCKVCKP